jgi:hypothetical protein
LLTAARTAWVLDRSPTQAEPCLTASMAYSTWNSRPWGLHVVTSVSYWFRNIFEASSPPSTCSIRRSPSAPAGGCRVWGSLGLACDFGGSGEGVGPSSSPRWGRKNEKGGPRVAVGGRKDFAAVRRASFLFLRKKK